MLIILNFRRFEIEKILEVFFIDVLVVYYIFIIVKKYVLLFISLEYFNMFLIIVFYVNRYNYILV